MAYETVLYDVADRICTITLNRPDKLNAWTRQMHLDLKDAMQTAGSDTDVRAIIQTGAGRGFCAGGLRFWSPCCCAPVSLATATSAKRPRTIAIVRSPLVRHHTRITIT